MHYGYYGLGLGYWGIIILSFALGIITQAYIKHQYSKWSKVSANLGGTGAEVARRMLDSQGASEVGITRIAGTLTDNYDPRDNMLHLSEDNFSQASVASVAVACHEAGHAVQTARGYVPIKVRSSLVPVVNFTQNTWYIVLLAGMLLNMTGLTTLAIIFYAFSVVFHLVTLPVEIDASRRAVKYIESNGISVDARGARSVLIAAALTYVSAALISIIQLLYLIGRTRRD